MGSLAKFRLIACAALAVFPVTFASPMSLTGPAILQLRNIEAFNDCTKDQTAKLKQDFKDAGDFAAYAAANMNKDSNAYKHYIRDDDWDNVKKTLQTISKYGDNDWKFSVRCAASDDQVCGQRTSWSWAITDAQPETDGVSRQMLICPKYFTDDTTKRSTNTDGKTYKPNPGRRDKSWCILSPFKLKDFMVGGMTLLHEMTHLDVVGKAAGLPEFEDDDDSNPNGSFKYHGTLDSDPDKNNFSNPPKDARDLKTAWDNNKHDGLIEPWRNAESIAAAAFEFWILDKCQYNDMDV